MKTLISLLTYLILGIALATVTSCKGTLQGAGDDIENAGDEIQDAVN